MHVQLFSKMDPTTEAYGCISTLIMSWDSLPFWSPRSLPVLMQTESIPWPQGWAFYLLAIAELSFCHQLCPCSVWVRKKPWILLHLTNTRCSAQMSTFTSVAMFLSSVAAEKSDSSLKQTNEWLPWWLSGKESTCQCRRHGFNPWSGKIPYAMEQLSWCITTIEPVL